MTPPGFATRFFAAPEVRLAYQEGPPAGPPLLLVHGTASRWQPFAPLMPALAQHFHVFAPDLRGHGLSGHAPGNYRLQDYTRDLSAFLAEVVRAPAALYGHSLGALAGMHLAAEHPEQVRALVMGDPPVFYHDTPIGQTRWLEGFSGLLELMLAYPDPAEMDAYLAQEFPTMAPERREERVQTLATLDPDVLRVIIAAHFTDGVDFAGLPARVTCPVLLLRGEEEMGSAVREQDVEFLRGGFAHLQVLEMTGLGPPHPAGRAAADNGGFFI